MSYYPYGKRFLDIALCLLALPLALPLMAAVAFVSAVVFRQQVVFSHQRPGYQGRPFTFYKFSTLQPEVSRNGRSLTEIERQTAWGKFLRDYSLDELLQLYNILKGDMSWVGPRPLLMEYLSVYSPAEAGRHAVKPGLTGLAQVMGRNEISWQKKMFYDQQYVSNLSLKLDLFVLVKTIATVCGGQRVNVGSPPQTLKEALRHAESIQENKALGTLLTTDKSF